MGMCGLLCTLSPNGIYKFTLVNWWSFGGSREKHASPSVTPHYGALLSCGFAEQTTHILEFCYYVTSNMGPTTIKGPSHQASLSTVMDLIRDIGERLII